MLDPLAALVAMNIPQRKPESAERISTGSPVLDVLLGGGWVKGGINEITGEPETGKSLLTLLAINETLKSGGKALLIDSDNNYDAVWASRFVDVSNKGFILIQNVKAEGVFNFIHSDKAQQFDLIVLDSWSALPLEVEISLDLTRHMAEAQKMAAMRGWAFSSSLKQFSSVNTTLLFTSHKPVVIGHVVTLPAYTRHCDVRVETLHSRRTSQELFIRARCNGGKVTHQTTGRTVERVEL